MKIKDFIPWMVRRRVLFLALLMLIPGASAWTTNPLFLGFTTSPHSLDYKSNGDICYLHNSSSGLMYECCNPTITTCYGLTVIEDTTGYKGKTAVLDIDTSGNPHVAYINTSGLCYWDGTNAELLDANVDYLGNIEADGGNNPHIAYKYGTFPDTDAKELYKKGGTWFTIDYGPDTRAAPSLHLDQYNERVYFARVLYSGGDAAGSIQVFNHSFDSSTYSQYENFHNDSVPVRNANISDFLLDESEGMIYFGLAAGNPLGYGLINASVTDNNINRPITTDAWYSFAEYSDVVYFGYEEGGEYKIGDVSTFTASAELTNLNNEFGTLRITPDGYKYVLYTHTDGYVYIAYDIPTVTVTGNILDIEDSEPIFATICYSAYCDVTNVTGGYSVIIPSGTYDVNISGAFGYPDYYSPSLTFTEDSPNINYYLLADDLTLSENITALNLLFIDYDESTPKTSETFKFEYIEGCPALTGSSFFYTTNSEGRISQNVYIGSYEITSMDNLLFYDEINDKFIGTLFIGIGEDYSDTIRVKEFGESLIVRGNVWGYDQLFSWESRENLSGASIVFYNDDYSFNKTSNASGGYEITNLVEGMYNYVCSATGYLSAIGDISAGMGVYLDADIITHNFELINKTDSLYNVFGVVTDQDDNPVEGVTVSIYKTDYADSGLSNASGHYNISGLVQDSYEITAMKGGYDQYYYIDEVTGDIEFFTFEITFNDVEYDIILQNQSAINYYCARGNVTDENNNLLSYVDVSVYPKYHWSGAGSFSYKIKKTNSVGYVEICGLRDNKDYIMDVYLPASNYGKETRHFSISGANYTFTIPLPTSQAEFLVVGSIRECELSIPINARINFKNSTDEDATIIYSLFSQDGVFSSDSIENGTYYLDIFPDETNIYKNKTNIELVVMSDLFDLDYCLNRFSPFYTWGVTVYFKEFSEHIDDYIFGGNVEDADVSFKEANTGEFYSCKTDATGYCSKMIPEGDYSLKVFSPAFGELLPAPISEDNPYHFGTHKSDILYYYVLNGSVSPVDQERALAQRERAAGMEIRTALVTYVPTIFVIMLGLFLFSAYKSAMNS